MSSSEISPHLRSSISYQFDRYSGNAIQDYLAQVSDDEVLGATIPVLLVDMSTAKSGTALARKREYSVIPSSSGDDSETLTYSGELKACDTAIEKCTVSLGEAENPLKCNVVTIVTNSSASTVYE